MSITITVQPTEEPISLDEAKLQVEEIGSAHDAMLTSLIKAARQHVEAKIGRGLLSQTRALRMDCFPAEIVLREGLVTAVSSITYVDTDGATQTLAPENYQADLFSDPPRIRPAFTTTWPATRDQLNAVTVTYVCGYANAVVVPENIKSAIKLILGDLFATRESGVVGTIYTTTPNVDALLADHVAYAS